MLDTSLVEVRRLVHVVDLLVEVARRMKSFRLSVASKLREHVVEVLLESGAREEVEDAAREVERHHLADGELMLR